MRKMWNERVWTKKCSHFWIFGCHDSQFHKWLQKNPIHKCFFKWSWNTTHPANSNPPHIPSSSYEYILIISNGSNPLINRISANGWEQVLHLPQTISRICLVVAEKRKWCFTWQKNKKSLVFFFFWKWYFLWKKVHLFNFEKCHFRSEVGDVVLRCEKWQLHDWWFIIPIWKNWNWILSIKNNPRSNRSIRPRTVFRVNHCFLYETKKQNIWIRTIHFFTFAPIYTHEAFFHNILSHPWDLIKLTVWMFLRFYIFQKTKPISTSHLQEVRQTFLVQNLSLSIYK